MKNKDNVDFHSSQLYINRKDDVEAINKDFKNSDSTNKSEYLRDLIMLGLQSKNNVFIKEKEQKEDLKDVIAKLAYFKNSLDHLVSIEERLTNVEFSLKELSIKTNSLKTISNQMCLNKEMLTKVLGAIYNMVNAKLFRYRLNEEELNKGTYDKLPLRFRGDN